MVFIGELSLQASTGKCVQDIIIQGNINQIHTQLYFVPY